MAKAGRLQRGTVALTFRDGVKIDAVHKALAELIKGLAPGGCTACGFNGIDVLIRGGDPEIFKEVSAVRGIKEVLDVSVMPQQMMA